ncbi:MAG: RHS repeat domain-containing protein [Pyrinomonadaceae bacterium]
MKKAYSITFLFFVLFMSASVFGEDENTKNNKDQTKRSDAKINPTSLGIELSIPLGTAPGRAGNSLPITFSYSSKVWRTEVFTTTEDGHNVYWAYPNYGEDSFSGWTSSLRQPWVEDTSMLYYGASPPNPIPCGMNFQVIRKKTIHMSDGSTFELAATLTRVTAQHCYETIPTVYYSFDGSNLKYVINGSSSTLYMPNGSRYEWTSTGLEHIDRNGNRSVYQASQKQWTDTMGRVISVPEAPLNSSGQMIEGDVDYYVPTMPGRTMKWTFKWKKLQYSFGNLNGTYQVKQLGQLFTIVYPQIELQSHNPVVLNEIVQPDGRSYKFYYNEYGEIEKIEYPTGSTEKFTHSQFGPFSFGGRGQLLVRQGNRGVASRVVSIDSNPANDLSWAYDIPTNSTTKDAVLPYTVKTTNPDGTRTERLLYVSDGNAGSGPPVLPSIMGGKEYESKFFDSTNTLKRRELTKWSGSYYGSSWINAYAKVDKKTSIMIEGTSALAQSQMFSYDGYLNQTAATEYDFIVPTLTTAQGGDIDLIVTGAALRTSETSYVTDANYVNRQMVSLPMETRIKDASGNVKTKSQITYDGESLLTDISSTRWQNPNTNFRGNVTSSKSWSDIAANQFVDTRAQYDQLGNMRNSWDGKGNLSQIEYSSTYDHAYPTKTISPVPGGNGSTTAFETTAIYDFNTGLPTSVTDANGQTTTMEYNDPLLRPTKVIAPNGHQTITEYGAGTTASTRFVKVRSQIDETNWKEGYSWYDGLGRTIKSQSVDTAGDVFVETEYDNMGRAKKATNPYRANETKLWTENTFDSAGRPWKVTTPDNAVVETQYSLATTGSHIGTVVTVKDQALKERRSITNALGQLTRVDEPTGTANGDLGSITAPNQPTSYAYDVLNNLKTVNQGVQTRTFAYNSLSRLTSATNPESGTINYAYDNNGNLTQKDDARGVRATYIYDNLNRVTNRNYSLTGSTPPNYQASPNVEYFYDGSNAAGGIANSKGKLTKVASSISTTEYMAFDILGRVTRSKQTTDGVEYGGGTDPTKWMTYTYNLSGALIEQQYPSGRVVKNTLSTDGDLQQVQSRRINDTFRNYANGFAYTAAGAVASMRLGNGKSESTQFNSRLQPTQIGLGNSATNQNLLKLNYDCGTTQNNGNVLSQTITVPSVGTNNGFVAVQNYNYDSLNRLKDATENVTPNGGTTSQLWKQAFTFDRYGNRRFDPANTTTIPAGCAEAVCNPQIDPATNKLIGYVFDTSGNTTTDANGQTFTYDGENKQVQVNNAGGIVGQYHYDGDGKRVKKYVPSTGETTVFVYDAGGKSIADYSTVVEPQATAKISYLTNDHLGSPRITTDATGQTISRRDFRPYGEEIARVNYGSDSIRQKFTGYERDIEINLDFAQARYYGFTFGRFTSPDKPLLDQSSSEPQSWNLYLYAGNSPLKYTDPLGLWKQVDCEGGSTNCWEMEEGDTLESLAELLGVSSENINEFFLGQELVEGRVFDMSGYADWVKQGANSGLLSDRERKDMIEQWSRVEPPMGGGLKTIGKKSGLFGWIGKQAGRFGRWSGILSKPVVKTVADLAKTQLGGSSAAEMLRDASNIVKSFKGTPQQKAELLEEFTKQISQRVPDWNAVRSVGGDGSVIFHGKFGQAIVVSPTGQMFTGMMKDGISFGKGGLMTPLYEFLKKID